MCAVIARKQDSDEIKRHIDELKAQTWLGPAQAWWPNCLFRVEPVEAAASILEDGQFLSRAGAIKAGKQKFDSASPAIISGTDDQWKEYVRLYFRPRSPTQFSSEGFRRAENYGYGSCCPMPIVLVLDAAEILTRAGTSYSNGNLAANAETGSDASFLRKIPFQHVYHDSWFDPSVKGTIIFHRHAEVIIPDSLDLAPVRFIGCRTQAEYETFMHLLSPATRQKWARKLGLGTKANLHFRNWMFVEQVALSQSEMVFHFNPSSRDRGPFKLRMEMTVSVSQKTFFWEKDIQLDDPVLKFNLVPLKISGGYSVRLAIDGRIAYSNTYAGPSAPF